MRFHGGFAGQHPEELTEHEQEEIKKIFAQIDKVIDQPDIQIKIKEFGLRIETKIEKLRKTREIDPRLLDEPTTI